MKAFEKDIRKYQEEHEGLLKRVAVLEERLKIIEKGLGSEQKNNKNIKYDLWRKKLNSFFPLAAIFK